MKVDGRIIVSKRKLNGSEPGFYGSTVKTLDLKGNLSKLKDPQDLALLVVKALLDNPTALPTHANEAAAVTAGLKEGRQIC